jgi:hypothetical protein
MTLASILRSSGGDDLVNVLSPSAAGAALTKTSRSPSLPSYFVDQFKPSIVFAGEAPVRPNDQSSCRLAGAAVTGVGPDPYSRRPTRLLIMTARITG